MSKKITSKNSKPRKLQSIFRTRLARKYLEEHPVTENMVDYICDELMEYATSKEALFISDFRREMRIPKTTWYDLVKRFPKLKQTIEDAKEDIAYGRYRAAASRHFDKGVIMHNQYRFGGKWKEDDQYQATLRKNDEDNSKQPIHVFLPENKRVIKVEKEKND